MAWLENKLYILCDNVNGPHYEINRVRVFADHAPYEELLSEEVNLIYSFIHNMYTITIQFERWVQIDTWREVQQDEESLVTALF